MSIGKQVANGIEAITIANVALPIEFLPLKELQLTKVTNNLSDE